MSKYTYLTLALLITPFVAAAQVGSFQGFFANLLTFVGSTVIPFLLGIGFLFVAINMIRYFVIGGSNEEGREKAKSLAIYGVAAFVFLLVFWGIVNMLSASIGLANCPPVVWDYYAPGRGPVNQGPPAPAAPCTPSTSGASTTPAGPAGPGPGEDSEEGGGDYGSGIWFSPN